LIPPQHTIVTFFN